MKTLFERLKPELRANLEQNRKRWKFSVDLIFDSLKDKYVYSDLTIAQVTALQVFSDIQVEDISALDFKFGDCFFEQEEI
jgi:hypothetical protein